MAVKKTIAILGATEELGTTFTYNLARYNFRLLLIGNDREKLGKITANVRRHIPTAEYATLTCQKDAGWEADTIIIALPLIEIDEVVNKIRQVSVQKSVIRLISEEDASGINSSDLEELKKKLPHAKLTIVEINKIRTSGIIYGDNEEAVEEASYLLRLAGFYPYQANVMTNSLK